MSSNIDAKLTKFESNSDLSEQNINFFGNRNDLGGLNLKKHPNNKGKKDKDSIFSESSNENNENEINQNENTNDNIYDNETEQKNFFNEKIKIVIFPEIL